MYNIDDTLYGVLKPYRSKEFRASLWVDGTPTDVQIEYGFDEMTLFGLKGNGIPSAIRIRSVPGEIGAYERGVDEWVNVTEESPDLLFFGLLDPRLAVGMITDDVAHRSLAELGWSEGPVTVPGSLRRFIAQLEAAFHDRWPSDFLEWLAQPEVDRRTLTFHLARAQPVRLVSLVQPDLSPDSPWLELRFID